jgi:hypothetical protein
MRFDKQLHGGRWAAVAFPNVLFAVVSWIFAQALAGYAAYGEAMYLSEISPTANDGVRGRRPFLVSRQTGSSAPDRPPTLGGLPPEARRAKGGGE